MSSRARKLWSRAADDYVAFATQPHSLWIPWFLSYKTTVGDRERQLVLSPSDLVELTRRERPAAQARVLQRLGIPFKIHPSDGVLLVARDAATAALGGMATPEVVPQFEVNVQAIRERHGTAPHTSKA